ncbi:MAG: hypothetical protein OXE76_03400 [Alphaproteobacteria bacterium]|nr:hypothetical protein [Alphaproteobacteria bacterium]
MRAQGWLVRRGFWPLALLWLPAGAVVQAVLRFGPGAFASPFASPEELWATLGSLATVAPCGLPLALSCRWLWRLGHRRAAWAAGIGLGIVTIPAAVVAGLLGPLAVAAWAALFSLPVWIAGLWLARRR